MRRVLPILFAIAACHDTAGAETLHVGNADRHYEVFVPSDRVGMPLVIALHGHGGTGRQMEKFIKLDEVAAREQFVVVYPDGVDHGWNDGREEIKNGADDVAYISSLIDEMAAQHQIDRKRVYVTGMSNGAMMSYRLACAIPDKIVAIAPVAGEVPAKPPCAPKHTISVLAINGTADRFVPYEGGQIIRDRGLVLSAPESTGMFAALDGCTGPGSNAEPDTDPGDGTHTTRIAYVCPGKLGVELLAVTGGGHTWPGAMQYLPKSIIGPVSRDFSATERIWQFFVDHTP
jgi:polyhydroxybutyrate depolymerase